MDVRFMIVRTVRVTNLKDVIKTHAYIWLVGILTPCHLLVEGACFIHSILKAGKFEITVTCGGGLLFPLFHLMGVGVATTARLGWGIIVAGTFLLVILIIIGFIDHIRVGAGAVGIG